MSQQDLGMRHAYGYECVTDRADLRPDAGILDPIGWKDGKMFGFGRGFKRRHSKT